MKKSKGRIILTIIEVIGGLFTMAATLGDLFVKDEEPSCPLLSSLDFKDLEDK